MATQLPNEAQLRELLSMVVGSEVGVQYTARPAVASEGVGAIGRYVDDEGVLRALVGSDLPAANALGAALALLPKARVDEAVAAGEVPADVAENLHEVYNVGANLFNAPDRPHLRLEEVLRVPDLPPELVLEMDVAADRLDVDIDVPGFGTGTLTIVAAGPGTVTRELVEPGSEPAVRQPSPSTDEPTDGDTSTARRGEVIPPEDLVASSGGLSSFDFEAPLPLPASAPRLVARVRDVSPRIGVALSVASGRVVHVTCTGAERVSSGHLAQPGITWCWVDCGVLGRAILVVPAGLTVMLADTFMGGSGAGVGDEGRPGTTLEQRLVLRHLGPALQPLVAAFAGNGLTALTFGEPETQPLPPSIGDLVALRMLTSLEDSGEQDTLTLALPARALLPGIELPIAAPPAATAAALAEVSVHVSLQLEPTTLYAADVDALCVGDVVRLEHPVDRPLLGLLDERVVLHATLGQRGRRRAVLVTEMLGESSDTSSHAAG